MRPDEPCVHERDETGPLARFFYNTGLPCAQCEREAHDTRCGSRCSRARRTLRLEPHRAAPDVNYPEPEPAAEAYVLEPRDDSPWEPWTLEQITALLTEYERSKRILVCAPDVYPRVRDAVEHSPLAAAFRVIEQPLLPDGQVLSIDPAALEPPPFEFEFTLPDYRCASCMRQVPLPGLCGICASMAGLLFGPRPGSTSIIAGLGGLT